jgi:putative SOS response-associated peptidase YedK
MCYSAMVVQSLSKLRREFSADPNYQQLELLFSNRLHDKSIRISRGFEANFDQPQNPEETRIRELIEQYRAGQATKLEKELFEQRSRSVLAGRQISEIEAMGKAPTKKMLEDRRIGASKADQAQERLSSLRRVALEPDDNRIFPMTYAPIIIEEHGKRMIELARYHCRQANKPTFYDAKFPGLYNARRDNIEKFWRAEFGKTHALMVVESFFENVDREGKNAVLHFQPNPRGLMLIACLYSRWTDPKTGEVLLSFAAVTDDPPREVAAAGHDRIIANLQRCNVDAWLAPQDRSDTTLQAILSDRQTPFYEHEVQAA